MKRVRQKMYTYFVLFIMLVGFILPNASHIVYATDIIESEEIAQYEKFSNVIFLSGNTTIDINNIVSIEDFSLFFSNDENVFNITTDGVITTLNKGYAVLTVLSNDDESYYVIVVDYEKQEFVDELIADVDLNIKIDYSNKDFYDIVDDIIEAGKESISKHLEINDKKVFDFYFGEGVDENVVTLCVCLEELCSSPRIVNYTYYGINSDVTLMELNVGETKSINVSFTEGHLSNLRYKVLDEDIAKVDKNGSVTGLNAGKTSLLVYDKYMKCFYEVPIWVDKDGYIQQSKNILNNTVFRFDIAETGDIGEDLIPSLIIKEIEKLDVLFDDIFEYSSYSTNVNAEEGNVTFVFDGDTNKSFTFQFELYGLFLHDKSIAYIDIGEKILTLYSPTDSGVVLTSSDEAVCAIEDNYVVGVSTGICNVTYKLGESESYRSFVVGKDEIKESLNHLLESIFDSIDLPMDAYDSSKSLEEYYVETFKAAIQSKLSHELQLPNDVTFSIVNFDLNEHNSSFDLRLEYYADTYNEVGYYTSREVVTSDNKSISINYLGHSSDWQEIGNEIADNLKNYYQLSFEQLLKYRVDNAELTDLLYYSDFYKDLYEICEDCDFVLFDESVGSNHLGFQFSDAEVVVLKDNEPLTNLYVSTVGKFVLEIDEIISSDYIEQEFKKRLHDTYKYSIKTPLVYNLFDKVKADNNIFRNSEYDYDIELECIGIEENNWLYNVALDGYVFEAALVVQVNNTDYDYRVKVDNIILSDNEVILKSGDKKYISFEVLPDYAENKNIRWISDDESIAKVSNGEIVGVAPGETTITVESLDGNTKAVVKVKVEPILIDNLEIDKTLLNLKVGESQLIEVKINPTNSNEKVIWKSNNESVAKVINGKIEALNVGNAIITVQSESGLVVKTIYVSVIDDQLAGDIDGDGKVNIVDLVKLRKHLAKIEELTGDPYKGADFNKDGTVNIKDLVNMRQHLAK